ncbi:hypothetical protein N0V93_002632 [Gnomoniopsis smithogilvyi]|uniref:Uncharacterized protein n=1 Tax=Gnomoniopsis smithogilvyi TaxID=1191159 RepID=A0A9W8YVP6_9PEZI|nr:hypothetical protein N0V93_002632 [Gnomoniopsis smithogilvyi]
MYQISFLDTPTLKGFDRSPINGKRSGANLTVRIVITRDGAIFQPEDPVRICAWLHPTPLEQPRCLSLSSGKKDDLFWTKTAAEQGFLAIVLRITLSLLDRTTFAKSSLLGSLLRIRADLPRVTPSEAFPRSIASASNQSIVDLHSTESSPAEDEEDKSSELESLLDQTSTETPMNVITIGINTIGIAKHLAIYLSKRVREDAVAQNVSLMLQPSTIVVADEANEVISFQGKDVRTEEVAHECIKNNYIHPMISTMPLKYAVRLRFQHLDSMGRGDGACDRAWSLIIAADNFLLHESTREATANQIEAITTSSIWHSTERKPPKLLLRIIGPSSENRMSLLGMMESDGWEVVETLDQLPQEAPLEDCESPNVMVKYFLLEYTLETPEYIEAILGNAEEQSSTRADQAKVADTESKRVTDDATDGEVTGQEITHDHLCDSEATKPVNLDSEARPLQIEQSQIPVDPSLERAEEIQNQGKADIHQALDLQAVPDPAVKRRGSPEELSRLKEKRLHTESSPEDEGSISEALPDATIAGGSTDAVLQTDELLD